jgi:hypothetical protein
MHNRFHKRSFVTFNNHLLDAMGFHLSEAETKSSPLKAVAEVQKMMYTCDLWAQMSPDYFFSAVLLRSLYPFAPIRQSLLLETKKFLRQQSTTALPIPASTDKHPLFKFAATYIQNIHDSRTFVSNLNPNKSHHKTQVPITEVVVDTNLVVLNSLPPPALPLLLLQPLYLLPLPLPPILARIPISTKARPSTQELSVPYLALFFTLPTYIFNTMQTESQTLPRCPNCP